MTKNLNYFMNEKIKPLLTDIISFLENIQITNEQYSSDIQIRANILKERCRLYMEKLEIQTVTSREEVDNFNNTPYVDMQTKTRNNLEGGEYVESDLTFKEDLLYQNPSSKTSPSYKGSVSSAMDEYFRSTCPYKNLPAQMINTFEKKGNLIKRDKFFFIDHHKKIFAALQDIFFLIYFSQNDNKPSRVIDLTNYNARFQQSNGKENKKKHIVFELITNSNKKNYQFITRSYEEGMEWLQAINGKIKSLQQSTPEVQHRFLPPVPLPRTKIQKSDFNRNTYEIVNVQIEVDYSRIENDDADATKNEEVEEKTARVIKIPLPPRIPEGDNSISASSCAKKIGNKGKQQKRVTFFNMPSYKNYESIESSDVSIENDEESDPLLLWPMDMNEEDESDTYDTVENVSDLLDFKMEDCDDHNYEKGINFLPKRNRSVAFQNMRANEKLTRM